MIIRTTIIASSRTVTADPTTAPTTAATTATTSVQYKIVDCLQIKLVKKSKPSSEANLHFGVIDLEFQSQHLKDHE